MEAEQVQETLSRRQPQWAKSLSVEGDLCYLSVEPGQLLETARALRELPELPFHYFSFATAVDREEHFEALYLLQNLERGAMLFLRTRLAREGESLPSLTAVYSGANWHERETYDLFGIRFEGHPDLRRILLPEHFEGHPLRKDYEVTKQAPKFRGLREPGWVVDYPHPPADGDLRVLQAGQTEGLEQLVVNFGPQHPSTHGVLRVIVRLDGESVAGADPDIGFLHRGIEEMMERHTYAQNVVFTDRLDYVSAITNEFGYVLAVEQLAGIEVPKRAQYLRVLSAELQRIASHLIFVGTFGNDLAATTVFLYAFRDRERVIDLLDELSGQRLTHNYLCIGGVQGDAPPGFDKKVLAFVDYFSDRVNEYDGLLTGNRIFLERTKGVGPLSTAEALDLGVSGPNLRATGLAYDIRKAEGYSSYGDFDFDIPTGRQGDTFDRYWVRVQEMRQSLRIIRQAVEGLPEGEFAAKVPRALKPPAGAAYGHTEGSKGDIGYYLVSDGSERPYRAKIRGPSFVHVAALPYLLRRARVGDLIAVLGSIDILLGEVDR